VKHDTTPTKDLKILNKLLSALLIRPAVPNATSLERAFRDRVVGDLVGRWGRVFSGDESGPSVGGVGGVDVGKKRMVGDGGVDRGRGSVGGSGVGKKRMDGDGGVDRGRGSGGGSAVGNKKGVVKKRMSKYGLDITDLRESVMSTPTGVVDVVVNGSNSEKGRGVAGSWKAFDFASRVVVGTAQAVVSVVTGRVEDSCDGYDDGYDDGWEVQVPNEE
jgi:hypothetical protein